MFETFRLVTSAPSSNALEMETDVRSKSEKDSPGTNSKVLKEPSIFQGIERYVSGLILELMVNMRLRNSLVSFFLSVALGQRVTITNGTVQGGTCPSSAANFYHSIPFAQPPIGNLRFAAPQPYNREFNGTLDATKAAPSCIQFDPQLGEPRPWSEDCLFLNVWTPQNASSCDKLPVKVWVYGGSNVGGGISNPMYDGCNAAVDSIVVSINYRLGPLGFLGLEKAGLSGNYAVQDILLGLQWVQDNIEAFGGDSVSLFLARHWVRY